LVDTALGRDDALGEESTMPEELRRRAIELTRQEGATLPQIAKDLGISDSCLRRWMQQAEVEEGTREGLTSSERKVLVKLRRRNLALEMEVEILKRASAFFATENVLPK
jgi:transposase-like protein